MSTPDYCTCKLPSIVQKAEGLGCAACGKLLEGRDEKCATIDAEVREIKREIGSIRRATRTTNERLDALTRRLEQLTTGQAS